MPTERSVRRPRNPQPERAVLNTAVLTRESFIAVYVTELSDSKFAISESFRVIDTVVEVITCHSTLP